MKQYNRIMLGRGSMYAEECRQGGFIGTDFDIYQDLKNHLPENWREFNKEFIPVWLEQFPEKSKTAAGLACGFLWTVCKGLKVGATVLSPDGSGSYFVGTITSEYYYVEGAHLPHQRKVEWLDKKIRRVDMSDDLRHSIGSIGTCSDATRFAEEIERLLGNAVPTAATAPTIPPAAPKHMTERSLHRLFCNYLRANGIYGKTIYHEKSSHSDTGKKWIHPDLVGASFVDFERQETVALMRATEPKKTVAIASYEMKIRISNDYELKQYFFQALSNSSWANVGYLVAFEIDESVKEEMKRLNEAFGIGIIRLQAKPEDTEILFPAREHELDYNTIDKLNNCNPDFSQFISKLSKVMSASSAYAEDVKATFIKICDPIFNSDEEIEQYCNENQIAY